MKKRIIIIGICVVAMVVIIVVRMASPSFMWTPREITMDRAMREVSAIYITSEEIEMLHRIRLAPELANAIAAEILSDIPNAAAHNLVSGVIPDGYTELIISIGMDMISIDYRADNHRVILTSLIGGENARKTISVERRNGNVRAIYENFGNEVFQRYQRRLRLFTE